MTDSDRSPAEAILSGVDTLARLLVLRQQLDERDGLTTATMVSGYPGSPLGGFDLTLDRMGDVLAEHRIVHRPGLNEELAAATVWGSQMGAVIEYDGVDGVAGAWYGKGPGLDRAGDAIKHANAMGAGPNGGVVMFCGDDPLSKSSTLACDSQFTFEDACVPVLYPGDQQDVLDLGVHAFRLSRYAGCWAGLKIVTSVADGVGTVDLDPARHRPELPDGVVIDGGPWRHRPLATIGPHAVPGQEALVVEHRLRAAQAYARHNGIDRVVGAEPGARLGVVCAGKTYFDVVQAFADLGVRAGDLAGAGVRILKLGMTYPLVEETVLEFAGSVERLVVIEEKRPFVETRLRGILHEAASRVPVLGKRDGSGRTLASSVGELDATAIAGILTRLLPDLEPRHEKAPEKQAKKAASATRIGLPLLQPPSRAPGFCSGCPHNRSTVAPDGALVGGGVGCHGIMYFEARHEGMRSLPPTPMGAEGVPWIGLQPFVAEPHVIQNLGDGTLSHSGTLAIRASVAAGADVTFKILYNAAVAMTGGQDVTGLMDVPAMTRALEAEGVRKIVVCAEDPGHYGRRARWADGVRVLSRDRLPDVQEELRKVPGVTAIIYDQRCAAEARRLRKRGELPDPPRRVVINEAVCEGCGDCSVKSNCLSVLPLETEFGEKRQIHDPSCNRDYTCIEGDCPSFVTITPKSGGRRRPPEPAGRRTARPSPPPGTLPEPETPPVDGQYGIYFTGIGGTGVVTANRIIAAAAEAAGFVIGGMDQTGLSQKAGAVVSHLHLAADRGALGAATVSGGGADLYLSGDILQAAGPAHLAKVRPGRTVAVIDRNVTPTTAMLQSDVAPPDLGSLEAAITERVAGGRVALLDSQRVAEAVFADHLLANVVLLGAAFQLGGLPVALADVELAIKKQGKAAATNREAFEWGRWAVHDPAAVEAALAAAAANEDGKAAEGVFDPSATALETAARLVAARDLPDELRDLLTRRAAQAVDYQNARRAERFLGLVERAAARDGAEHGWRLTEAVAEAWFKLLTYKDEYEVARLHLKVDYDQVARDLGIEGPYSVAYQLHPPFLRRLGRKKKLPMGKPYALGFRVLRRMKRVRGTPLDVFGWDRDRRMERAVAAEYERLIGEIVAPSCELPYDALVGLAGSALSIKGYAGIKEAAVVAWRERVAELRRAPVGGRTG
ncbi:indolepyruvate ferredoxin oxidoreductase family protein [Actinomadura sp. LD22]|uniref:Indolepyruvate ferredoxin oxidoreductase family protein n=1 Tax=Actinomadura physcomitrii TaxID=2650748 RepID=A0A6I4MMU2_9ACTN|nr:indolepyruvate ferredoxin oxidoreductase family protein [Actinomadura physcomitrii]MWA03546.1 indolepyruvate ferredoxin oxidoreductase family protein [Actinomadura physcomitrii]